VSERLRARMVFDLLLMCWLGVHKIAMSVVESLNCPVESSFCIDKMKLNAYHKHGIFSWIGVNRHAVPS